jgi:DNA polymerase elongation subunit (family B)
MNSYIINEKDLQKISSALRRGELKFYQFYNTEFSADEYQFQDYMTSFKEKDAEKKILNKTYYDIEVYFDPEIFPDPEKANYMVNSVAVYNNLDNIVVAFVCPFYKDMDTHQNMRCNIYDQSSLQTEVEKIYQEMVDINDTYRIENLKIDVRVFSNEKDLLKAFFEYVKYLHTLFLIGFNSSLFDNPYVLNRGLKLFGNSVYNYISLFGEVQKFGARTFEWPDYILVDLLTLYKPVDSGGMGFGKSLPNYRLDTVAEVELSIKKLDLDDLNESYKTDIARFVTYNIFDTLLTFKLDEKLQFLELNWMLAKYNDAPMSSAIRGRSLMYRYRNDLIYTRRNQIVRSKLFGREIFYPLKEYDEF